MQRHPNVAEIFGALITIEREIVDARSVLAHARKLAELLPDDGQVKALATELSLKPQALPAAGVAFPDSPPDRIESCLSMRES